MEGEGSTALALVSHFITETRDLANHVSMIRFQELPRVNYSTRKNDNKSSGSSCVNRSRGLSKCLNLSSCYCKRCSLLAVVSTMNRNATKDCQSTCTGRLRCI